MGSSTVKVKCPNCDKVFLPTKEETQRRAGRSARTKGQAFERKIAKALQDWWPGRYEFRRSPQSGGSVLKEGFDMAGDICTNAPDFLYHLELKNTPSQWTGLHQYFTSEKFALWDYLDQAEKDRPKNKIPLVIFTRTGQPTFCASYKRFFKELFSNFSKWPVKHLVLRPPRENTFINHKNVVIWSFDDMLKSSPMDWIVKSGNFV